MREDLHLPPGKAACKMGEAMLKAFRKSTPDQADRYFADGEGTQVCLTVPDQDSLIRLHAAASGKDYPTSIVIEGGRLIAIGIGPVERARVRHLTEGLPRMK